MQCLQQINVNKYPSSNLQCDSISQPLEHESPPMTTELGPLHLVGKCCTGCCQIHHLEDWVEVAYYK